MSDLNRIKAARLIFSASFWVATFVFYLTVQGLRTEQVFQILAIYYIAVTIFEYPTGAIADYTSHKWSATFGYIGMAFSMLLFSFEGSYYYYMFVLVLYAFAMTLRSGSDVALLHDHSDDFKRDETQLRMWSVVVTFFAVSLGGYLATFDQRLPYYMTAAAMIVAALLTLPVTSKQKKNESHKSLVDVARASARLLLRDQRLFHIAVVGVLLTMISYSFKWLYNPLFVELEIGLAFWGFLAGFSMLLIAVGVYLFKRYAKLSLPGMFGLFLVGLVCIGMTDMVTIALGGLFSVHIIKGYLETRLSVGVHNYIPSDVRASVISFIGLLGSLFIGAYSYLIGFVLEREDMATLMILTSVGLFVLGVYSLLFIVRKSDI